MEGAFDPGGMEGAFDPGGIEGIFDPGPDKRSLEGDCIDVVLVVGCDVRSSAEEPKSSLAFDSSDESASLVEDKSGLSAMSLSATSLSADGEVVRFASATGTSGLAVGSSGGVGGFEIFVGSGSGNMRGAFMVSAGGGGGGSIGGNIGGGGGTLRRGGIGGGGKALIRSMPALDHSSS